jgi:hypothetical protein
MADTVDLRLGLNFPALTAAYCIWKGEGTFASIFPDNPDMSLWEFLDLNYQPTCEPVGCYVDDAVIGIGWICQAHEIDGRVVAEVGTAFFKTTPSSAWHQALELFLRHAFETRGFAAIYAISQQGNREGELIAKLCGMREVERLPWAQEVPPDRIIRRLSRSEWEIGNRRAA